MRMVVVLFWVLTILGVVIGGLVFLAAIFETSAPQQAAAGTIALGFVVIPYVLARSVSEIALADSASESVHHQSREPVDASPPPAANPHWSLPVSTSSGQRPSDADPSAQKLWDLLQDGPCSQQEVFDYMLLE